MGQTTAKYELLQLKLGRDLAAYVAEARSKGRDWRTMAADLSVVTGVPVSHETLRAWFTPASTSAESA